MAVQKAVFSWILQPISAGYVAIPPLRPLTSHGHAVKAGSYWKWYGEIGFCIFIVGWWNLTASVVLVVLTSDVIVGLVSLVYLPWPTHGRTKRKGGTKKLYAFTKFEGKGIFLKSSLLLLLLLHELWRTLIMWLEGNVTKLPIYEGVSDTDNRKYCFCSNERCWSCTCVKQYLRL